MNPETAAPTALTKMDLLQAPLWVAERVTFICAKNAPDFDLESAAAIEALGRQVREDYAQRVMERDRIVVAAVAPNLHASLMEYSRRVALLVPSSALYELEERLFIIPAEATLDWEMLIGFFLSVHDDLQAYFESLFPPDLLRDYVRLHFVFAILRLIGAGVDYDRTLVRQELEALMATIQHDGKIYLAAYWARYSRPPLRRAIDNITFTMATLRFEAASAEMTGIPVIWEQQLRGWVTDEDYVAHTKKWLYLHELKEDELRKRLANEPPPAKSPLITIEPEEADNLHKALQYYVIEAHRDDLRKVLIGERISDKITIDKTPIKSWCHVFYLALEGEAINNTKSEVMEWLACWFNICRKGKIESFTAKSLGDYFYRSSKPAKSYRIPYKPLKKAIHMDSFLGNG